METLTPSEEAIYISLQDRLQKAAKIRVRRDPRGRKIEERTVHNQIKYLPGFNVESPDLSTIETFVELAEALQKFKLASTNRIANHQLSKGIGLARKLRDELPGNDGGVMFFYKGMQYLEEANPALAEDISRVMIRVYDEQRFEGKR